MSAADPIVGIDLGTSNSVVGYCDETGHARVLADAAGYKVHPSVVSFHPNGSVVVGAQAKQRRIIDPTNTVFSAKRLIGRSFRSAEVKLAQARMPYLIKEGQNQAPMISTRGGDFAVPEISAIVLDHIRDIAATSLNAGVNRAVITVPANFNDAQRSATATAGAIAGITVVRVLNEPTAAALAYGHTRPLQEVFAVYDFGGGTFDITVLRLRDSVYEVLGTAGDSFLGGDDLDEKLVELMVERFLQEQKVDLRLNEVAMMRMRAVAEQAKIELSRRTRAIIKIDEIAYGAGGAPLHLNMEVSRDEFVARCAEVVDKTFPVCQEALRIAGVTPGQLGEIILVGGTTKMPYVRDKVAKFFGQGPRTDTNPEEAVALGASLQAISLQRILSRPRSGSISSQWATQPATADSLSADLTGDLTKEQTEVTSADRSRHTSAFGSQQLDTSTGVRPTTHGGVERFFEEPSTTVAQPLARITRPGTVPPVVPSRPVPPTTRPRVATIPPLGQELPRVSAATTVPAIPQTVTAPGNISIPAAAYPPDQQATQVRAPRQDALGKPITRERVSTPPPVQVSSPQANTLISSLAAPSATERGIPALPTPPGFGAARQVESQSQPTATTAPLFTAPLVAAAAAAPLSPAQTHQSLPPPMVRGVPGTTVAPPLEPQSQIAPVFTGKPAAVVDVVPHSFGIATVGGYCEELIRRNASLPVEIKRVFSTSRDRQDKVTIQICQGQSRRLEDNVVLGDIVLDRLQPRPRGETAIEVTFVIDSSGMLQVRARDATTGREQRANIDIIGAMSTSEVAASRDRMAAFRRS